MGARLLPLAFGALAGALVPASLVAGPLVADPTGALVAAPDTAGQAQLIDGIAAIVNDEVISIGEVHRAARLLAGRERDRPATGCGGLGASAMQPAAEAPEEPADGESFDGETLTAALECLIDGTLVFREVRRFPQLEVTRAQVLESYHALVESWPSRGAFERELERAGLSPAELQRDLRRQLLVATYVDSRFRGTVDVTEQEARTYFEQTLAPDMQARGIEPPAFEQVAEAFVIPILREREVNRRVESWIGDLRARAEIAVRYPESR